MAKLTLKNLKSQGTVKLDELTKKELITIVQTRYAQLSESLKAEDALTEANKKLAEVRRSETDLIGDLQARLDACTKSLIDGANDAVKFKSTITRLAGEINLLEEKVKFKSNRIHNLNNATRQLAVVIQTLV